MTVDLSRDIAIRQSQGERDYQEDSAACRVFGGSNGPVVALVLADGMGGQTGGAVASRVAVAAALDTLSAIAFDGRVGSDLMRGALDAASDAVAIAARDASLPGMGCTLVLATVAREGLRWLSVGDSPLWIWRRGKLARLNVDHSMRPVLRALVDRDELTLEQADSDPRRTALRSAVTGTAVPLVDCPETLFPLRVGDWVILASDGLQTLNEDQISAIVGASRSPEAAVSRILTAVAKAGQPGQDNTTVMLFRCSSELLEPGSLIQVSVGCVDV